MLLPLELLPLRRPEGAMRGEAVAGGRGLGDEATVDMLALATPTLTGL